MWTMFRVISLGLIDNIDRQEGQEERCAVTSIYKKEVFEIGRLEKCCAGRHLRSSPQCDVISNLLVLPSLPYRISANLSRGESSGCSRSGEE